MVCRLPSAENSQGPIRILAFEQAQTSSDSESEDGKVYSIEVGPDHQATLTKYGAISLDQSIPMWNPDMLPARAVVHFLQLAKNQWEHSILEKYA
jgi:hypothetical protein